MVCLYQFLYHYRSKFSHGLIEVVWFNSYKQLITLTSYFILLVSMYSLFVFCIPFTILLL
jgi:hypothetical protein